MRTALSLLLLCLLAACAAEKKARLLSPANLPVWTVAVSGKKDTVLRTPKGALLRIRKGTFDAPVQLLVQEAYTLQDMLLGGLSTEAGGRPLASGGMIRISTTRGDDVPVRLPIDVALPTPYIDPKMELYKGEMKGDTLDWVRTDSLTPSPATAQLEIGQQLFQQNCATCHRLNQALTGPPLRGFWERGPWKKPGELYKWIHNPALYLTRDPYTKALQQQYGAIMQAFPQLQPNAIDAIVAYLKNEAQSPWDDVQWRLDDSTALATRLAAEAAAGSDSLATGQPALEQWCSDTTYFQTPTDTTTAPEPVSPSVFEEPDAPASPADLQGMRNGFTDRTGSGAYRFEVKTLGWYNVDAEVAGQPGTVPADLLVEVLGVPMKHMEVYVFFPAYKDLTVGNHTEGNVVSFRKVNGKLPVYLGAEGVVVVFGSVGDGLYVGTRRFTARSTQRLTVTVMPSTEETFLELIRSNRIEGIDLRAYKQERSIFRRPCDSDSVQAASTPTIMIGDSEPVR